MLHLVFEAPMDTLNTHGPRACVPVSNNFSVYYPKVCREEFEFAKRIVKEVDDSELLSPMTVASPVFDIIPIEWISNGAKSLILMHSKLDFVFSLDFMGDECFPIVSEIAQTKEVFASISVFSRLLLAEWDYPMEVYDVVVHSLDELIEYVLRPDAKWRKSE